ncbi:acyl-CoA synthetase (AMP-forming)/AMP-acid ligase II [Mycolicibacterium mucogenicum 261Sha1.1M5]|nr:acyl-CoA synthetase (AMP-forming)/AMP-acid ligase II [Mycolicibacterium mucogenicum 261Sha1.1M5]
MFQSHHPDVEIPNLSIFDYLFGSLKPEELDRIALINPATGAETTYGTLRDQIEAVAGALAARGVGPGSVVGLLSPNIPEFATVFHGALRAGATVTTLNALYTPAEIEKQLLDAKATWLFTVSPLLPQAQAGAEAAGIPTDRLVVLDGADGHPNLRDLLTAGEPAPDLTIDPQTTVAVLPYSSGTTGTPKGVMLTHRNLVANVEQSRHVMDLNGDDRVLAVLPFFHIYGMTVLLNIALFTRASLVTMPKFDLVQFLGNIQRFECTYVFVAPPIMVALAKHPIVDKYDISSVRTLFSGAAPLDGATAERAAARLGTKVLQGYGMSELSPVSHLIPAERTDIPRSSIGLSIPNVVCKLVDTETGEELTEYGEDGLTKPGELWVKGPNVMVGYLGKPEATAESITEDGFLRTGDIAVRSKDDWYAIVDRAKELIKYKGYQVAPAELEALLLTHPEIADAAVIGVTVEDGEEVPKAFVVRAEGSALAESDVMEFVTERVAPYKKVRRVEFIDTVPKSSAGKILRKDLRERERSLAG